MRLTATLLLFALVLPAQTAPPRHDFPRVGACEVLVGDFHMHAANSNLPITTRERVEESFRLGYDVIAITDHGNSRAYRVANHVGTGLGLVVLNGMETGLDSTEHLGVIGMSPDYEQRGRKQWAQTAAKDAVYYQEEMRRIIHHGGIIIYNHPNIEYEPAVTWGVEHGFITGIEVKNDNVTSKKTTDFQGSRCFPGAFDYALKHDLAIFADTDVHKMRQPDPARTLIFARHRTPDAVMDAIRQRRTAAWFDGMLWGREALLTQLINTMVVSRKAGDGKLMLTNLGPIALKGRADGSGLAFEIGPYGETALTSSPSAVTWTNVWTSSKTNLRTELEAAPRKG